jgi:REP element-mobilizing transposase RayT
MSLFKVYAHLVFSTHNRQRWLDAGIRERVHGYLATLARDLDSKFIVVGGTDDHVHMLLQLPKQ